MPVRRVVFDATLYLREAVDAAADAYREHASITIRPAPNGVVTTFDDTTDDEIIHAFCNHALFETVMRRKQASLES